ncbi:MAG: fructose-1,6-bisphosphatase [Peptostreptococcus sp.]|uniref:fructose-1,6-bisphosphatase n=1 Tax=Peptostreptococcus TaxID=1257 RepID=UPI00290C07E4|nr:MULTISPECIES: fructose-1,6-bisphosphatase [Peptostreptococcus]MDU3423580.1 fructose-1,6-bisphosphatase [Peptostreptococcus anaerobius]MDU3430405.1 fructose-1,6-bisphosphatase [Peptostreptococcus sp.]MDU3455444.1 fructose-1,6-bisphosphatase [Peptostreptococcus sp.]MDU5681599.1 fructose-1,6-bisphosphatase [Peptostreptococcus sp.]MDU5738619.1 fructose-1,6-bisphosphatase [Peptostreptococcus sp.]
MENKYTQVDSELDMKYLRLLSSRYPTISKASTEIINLEAILNLPKGTEHFLSDIHGEHEPFIHVLKNGSGVVRRKIDELFSDTMMESEKSTLATLVYYPNSKLELIRKTEQNMDEFYRIYIYRLVELCKYCSSKYTRSKVRKLLPEEYSYIIEELLHEHRKSEHKEEYYESLIDTIIDLGQAQDFIVAISKSIQRLVVDRLHIVGDIYDRGPRPDLIIDRLIKHHCVDIQWGNHDILWMGAAAGEKTCIANAVRISSRYANLDVLEDVYGINLLPLATFASAVYKDDPCKEFIPKVDKDEFNTREISLIAKMHKAISIIQFKLEGEIISRHPEYEMDHRLLLDKVDYESGIITIKGKEYDLVDRNFPTIDPASPFRLTGEEHDVVDKLVRSFSMSDKLQKHINFLFSKGSIYLKYNGNLLIHGGVPLNDDGSFMSMELEGQRYSGKALLDKMEALVREGYYGSDGSKKDYGRDLFWYLWTGKCSSLFGKDDMTTYERYFIEDKETHKENKNPYFTLREDMDILKHIFDEFDMDFEEDHIINGHVPVKFKKGESPVKAQGKVFVIDGGFSKAYQSKTGMAGYTLIYNSRHLKLIAHEPFTSKEDAVANGRDIISSTVLVEHKSSRKKIKDTNDGKQLQETVEDLKKLLVAYRSGLIKEK